MPSLQVNIVLLLLGVYLSCTSGLVVKTKHKFVLHEKRATASAAEHLHKWTRRSRAHPAEVLPVRIGLAQSNLHRAEEYLLEVSDPKSLNFGKHWTAERVANTFAPSKETLYEVVGWLVQSGIHAERHAFSTGRNWLLFNATVREAESLFNTKYHYYEHRDDSSDGYRIGCDEYHLPEHVQKHVDFAMPTIHLEGMRPIPNINLNALSKRQVRPPAHISGLTGLTNCYDLITIECLRHLYQFGPGNTSSPGNQLGIPQWGDYLGPPSDLALYFQNYTTQPIPANLSITAPEFISIDGGLRWGELVDGPSLPIGGESALDVQTAYSIIYPQNVRIYQVGDITTDSAGNFNTFLDALDGSYCDFLGGDAPYIDPVYPNTRNPLYKSLDSNLTNSGIYTGPLQCGGAPRSNVLSFSYLQIEAALPESYQIRQCLEWLKLGLQGVSVLFASGDSGVANRYDIGHGNTCVSSSSLPGAGQYKYIDTKGKRFSPSFPANCPWVTVVGGTFLKSRDVNDGEVAVSLPEWGYFSGGGFSDVFGRPAYQVGAVDIYLDRYSAGFGFGFGNDTERYNSRGRAYPDVSAIGLNVSVVLAGKVQVAGGTSASTPIMAGIVTLLNEARIQAHKGPIGFLNPLFYAFPGVFNDIVEGGNPGCGTRGFPAGEGWDPVTGLGTPSYPRLLELVLSLP